MDEGAKRTGWAQPASAESAAMLSTKGGASPGTLLAAPGALRLTPTEGEKFLRIALRSARIGSHLELFQLLQGDVQNFVPHQILICAWGDFFGPRLKLDVISAIPGVRTERLSGCNIENLLKTLYLRWIANKRRPLLLDGAAPEMRDLSLCCCTLHRSLQDMQSVLVHGIHDARDGSDSLYFAAHADMIVSKNELERFRHLIDPVIAQIDISFRRISSLRPGRSSREPDARALSAREVEILAWVSKGRTNDEISKILAISTFTVKNHIQRIIKKLGASNRVEAVAKYRQAPPVIRPVSGAPMRRKTDPTEFELSAG